MDCWGCTGCSSSAGGAAAGGAGAGAVQVRAGDGGGGRGERVRVPGDGEDRGPHLQGRAVRPGAGPGVAAGGDVESERAAAGRGRGGRRAGQPAGVVAAAGPIGDVRAGERAAGRRGLARGAVVHVAGGEGGGESSRGWGGRHLIQGVGERPERGAEIEGERGVGEWRRRGAECGDPIAGAVPDCFRAGGQQPGRGQARDGQIL